MCDVESTSPRRACGDELHLPTQPLTRRAKHMCRGPRRPTPSSSAFPQPSFLLLHLSGQQLLLKPTQESRCSRLQPQPETQRRTQKNRGGLREPLASRGNGADFPGGPVAKNILAMQKTWVRPPVRKDPTRQGAIKPVRHSYRACAQSPRTRSY